MGSFVQRLIRFDIELNDGAYTDKGKNNTVTIQNVKANVVIDFAGGATVNSAQATIWGLDKKLMDRLTVYPPIANSLSGNKVSISAGELALNQKVQTGIPKAQPSVIYSGDIFRAYGDYSTAPDVPFIIETTVNMSGATKEVEPISEEGTVDVLVLLDGVAKRLGNAIVQDNGVGDLGVSLANPYYSGTAMQMLRKIQQDANIDVYYTPPVIHVCPKGQPLITSHIPIINANTGLIGWPMMDVNGMVIVNVLYNPLFFHGSQVELQTSLPNCNGKFYITSMSVMLESQTPSGQWTATLQLANFALMTPQRV
jgi:hypothetical protein